MAIEIVDLPINSMVIFHSKMLVYQRVYPKLQYLQYGHYMVMTPIENPPLPDVFPCFAYFPPPESITSGPSWMKRAKLERSRPEIINGIPSFFGGKPVHVGVI